MCFGGGVFGAIELLEERSCAGVCSGGNGGGGGGGGCGGALPSFFEFVFVFDSDFDLRWFSSQHFSFFSSFLRRYEILTVLSRARGRKDAKMLVCSNLF